MLHFLTIGFLDKDAVRVRRIVVNRPLPPEVFELLDRYLDEPTGPPKMEGQAVVITPNYIECPWMALRLNKTGEAFALAAQNTFGCTVADIGHAAVITLYTPEEKASQIRAMFGAPDKKAPE